MEELGELAHAHLKERVPAERVMGIRGTAAEHQAHARDAVGDIIIYLADYCCARGWDLEEIVARTCEKVEHRDWKQHPHTRGPTP